MSERGAQWYKREPRAFLEGVRRLTEREIAVYAIVLDLIYDGGHQTLDDPKHIASYFSDIGVASVRRAIDALVEAGKLERDGEFLTNKRAKNEGKTRRELAETRKNSGHLGGVSSGKSRAKNNENNEMTEANASSVSPLDKIRVREEEIEANASLSETSSDARRKPKGNEAYTSEFEAFWLAYPRSPNMSKLKTFAAWRKLSDDDQRVCAAGVAPYRAFLAAKDDHPTMHATTFIIERRFDGFLEQAAAAAPRPITDDDWRKRLEFGRKNSKWHVENWGPIPGAVDCRVPEHLLQPGDGQGWAIWDA